MSRASVTTEEIDRAQRLIEARHLEVRTEASWDALAAAANQARHGSPEDQIAADNALNDAYTAVAESLAPAIRALDFEVTEGREAGAIISIEGGDVFPFLGDASRPVAATFRQVMEQYLDALDCF